MMANLAKIFTPGFILLLILILFLIVFGIIIIIYGKKGNKKKVNSKLDLLFYRLYFEFRKTPLTKTYIIHKTRQLQKMSVYTKKEVYTKVAKYFTVTALVTTATIIASLILFDDLVSVCLSAFLAYLLPNTFIEKRIIRTSYVVYYQLKYAIDALRLEYLRCQNIVESLENIDCGYRLKTIFDALHQVLVSANGELKLKEFYELTPFRPIQTLAQICYHINNTGDEIDLKSGSSAFVEALLVMTSDINEEMERLNYQHIKFGKLEYLCLIPIPCTKIIEWFLTTNMPGTVVLFKGPYGYIVRVASILVSIISYGYISRINNPMSLKTDDRIRLLSKLAQIKPIYKLLINIGPKNNKRRRVSKSLQKAFSMKSIEEFYLEKLCCSIITFFIIILTCLSSVVIGRQYMLDNVQTFGMVANNDLDIYEKEDILAMDNEYIALVNGGYVFEPEELNLFIKESLPKLTDLQVNEQIARLEKKYKVLQSMYFRWYFIPIAFMASLIAWNFPNRVIKNRIKAMQEEEEEEFLQIQTIMIILMSMNCDTMEAIEYLSQIAHVHKDIFLSCYHSYAADPIKALEKMEESTPIPEFKRFIGKLKLTVDELSLKDAFSDLKMNREHICRERDLYLREAIDAKRRRCSGIAKIGFYMVVLLMMVGPMIYIGFTEMMAGMASLQAL